MSLCALTVPISYYTFSRSIPDVLVLFFLALIWTCLGGWISGQWRWVWGKNWRELRAGFVAGEMPRLTCPARVISVGGLAFSVGYLMHLAGAIR